MQYFDAHCHIQDPRLEAVVVDLVSEYSRLGVGKAVVNGTRPDDWGRVADLARSSSVYHPSFGLHPWYVEEVGVGWESQLEACLLAFPHAAVGEIGLDRWIQEPNTELQTECFEVQLRLAKRFDRPVTIHCLKDWGRLVTILERKEFEGIRFMLHSYGGPKEMVDRFARLGAYFSLSGYFAWERKAKALEVFRSVPMDRLLIETDAPDMKGPDSVSLYPIFQNGEVSAVNNPLNLVGIYRFAAGLCGMSLEAFCGKIADNWRRLFGRYD